MFNLIAAISGEAVLMAVVWVIVIGLCFWLLTWLIDYCGVPEPFNKIARVILAIAAVVLLINALLGIMGRPFIVW